MPDLQLLIFLVILLALIFDFINGFHDTANAIATSVSTRAIHPQHAIIMAAVLNFFGAMYSTGVAKTIGSDIVKSASHVDEHVLIAALFGSIVWNVITWKFSMPSSSSHALVGGVIGAVLRRRWIKLHGNRKNCPLVDFISFSWYGFRMHHHVASVPRVWAFTSNIHQRKIQEDADPIGCYYGIFSRLQRCTEVYGYHHTRLIGWWIH